MTASSDVNVLAPKGWRPTEGHKRAEDVVQMLELDAQATGHQFSPTFRWRMVQSITRAIDKALRDGAEQDALAAMVGNGSAPAREPTEDLHWTQTPEGTRVTSHGGVVTVSTEPENKPTPRKRGGRRRASA